MNRFSKDIGILDEAIPWAVYDFLEVKNFVRNFYLKINIYLIFNQTGDHDDFELGYNNYIYKLLDHNSISATHYFVYLCAKVFSGHIG